MKVMFQAEAFWVVNPRSFAVDTVVSVVHASSILREKVFWVMDNYTASQPRRPRFGRSRFYQVY